MVRPSPAYSARLRLTTKQVNGGYYKGNRTGSMGAHTEWGGYVIDYRKVRTYNCPDLKDTSLTPFVSAQIKPRKLEKTRPDGTTFIPAVTNGPAFIEAWKSDNPDEYNEAKENWRKYLEEIEEIPVTETSRRVPDSTHIEDPAHIQGREDALAKLGEYSSKSKSKSRPRRSPRR